MKQSDGAPVWQLPITTIRGRLNEFIHRNAKYHCFNGWRSLCGKHMQDTNYYETGIESGEILSNPPLACKVCYSIWKRQYIDLGGDEDV